MHLWLIFNHALLAAPTCQEGMVLTTEGHCCWVGQFWSANSQRCVGEIEACPEGWRLTSDGTDCFNYREQERKRLEKEQREKEERAREQKEQEEYERAREQRRIEAEKRRQRRREERAREQKAQEEEERKRREEEIEAQREEAEIQALEAKLVRERNAPKDWYWGFCLGSGLSCALIGGSLEYRPNSFFAVGASSMILANSIHTRITPFKIKDPSDDYAALSLVAAVNLVLSDTYYYDYGFFSYGVGFEMVTGREVLRIDVGTSTINEYDEYSPHIALVYLQSF